MLTESSSLLDHDFPTNFMERSFYENSVIKTFEIDPDEIGQFVGRDYDVVYHSNEELDQVCVALYCLDQG